MLYLVARSGSLKPATGAHCSRIYSMNKYSPMQPWSGGSRFWLVDLRLVAAVGTTGRKQRIYIPTGSNPLNRSVLCDTYYHN